MSGLQKIYLSKSNCANPDTVRRVKHLLDKYYKCPIIEFNGGTYGTNSNQQLMESDILLVVGPAKHAKYNTHKYVGKGQWSQIKDFSLEFSETEEDLYTSSSVLIDVLYVAEPDITDDSCDIPVYQLSSPYLLENNYTDCYGSFVINSEESVELANWIPVSNYKDEPLEIDMESVGVRYSVDYGQPQSSNPCGEISLDGWHQSVFIQEPIPQGIGLFEQLPAKPMLAIALL